MGQRKGTGARSVSEEKWAGPTEGGEGQREE